MGGRANIVLGGIGVDCHSVGLSILRSALEHHDFDVAYLGVQNDLADFVARSPDADVVMISSMDGHSRYYLADFAGQVGHSLEADPLWYLGGNLGGDDRSATRHFLRLGFHRVFAHWVDVARVMSILHADLSSRRRVHRLPHIRSANAADAGPVKQDRLATRTFERDRDQVLTSWPSGIAAIDLEANSEVLRRAPSLALRQAAAQRASEVLLHPRCGVAGAERQLETFQRLRAAGATVLSYQVDSLTRSNEYQTAAAAIADSEIQGRSTLNGFPVVNHGVATVRHHTASLDVPLQVRHGTRDPRLLAEISFAGGCTGFEGGAISYNLPYFRALPLSESIDAWQYVDRLVGCYAERFGVVIDREFFGTLTATLIPPSIAIAVNVLEAMLASIQGVRAVSVGYAEQGHRIQDIAAIAVLREAVRDHLRVRGFGDVQVSTVFHQYMAAFPSDRSLAQSMIVGSASTAALAGATRVMLKTPVEAYRIPSLDDNLEALRLAGEGVVRASSIAIDESALADEKSLLRTEVDQLLRGILEAGAGDVAVGVRNAVHTGCLDIPFSPSVYNRGQVVGIRDCSGAVRFGSTGALPFEADVVAFHREKLEKRRASEGSLPLYRLVELDVMRLPRGEVVDWPIG